MSLLAQALDIQCGTRHGVSVISPTLSCPPFSLSDGLGWPIGVPDALLPSDELPVLHPGM